MPQLASWVLGSWDPGILRSWNQQQQQQRQRQQRGRHCSGKSVWVDVDPPSTNRRYPHMSGPQSEFRLPVRPRARSIPKKSRSKERTHTMHYCTDACQSQCSIFKLGSHWQRGCRRTQAFVITNHTSSEPALPYIPQAQAMSATWPQASGSRTRQLMMISNCLRSACCLRAV